MKLGLDADRLLTTTRAVRRRLDFDRPVSRAVLEECIEIALQAPSGGPPSPLACQVVCQPSRRQSR
jgi:nitroreductase